MIDATRSPRPLWKRLAIYAVLAVLVIVLGTFIWTKDLHHSSPAAAPASPPAAVSRSIPPSAEAHAPAATPAVKIPGGLAISGRNPFAG
ncbi:MAG: hypothetical protein ACYC1D_04280 [Acidimicrobiales bacterium]